MRAGEGDSLSKQAVTPLKPRGGATFGTGSGDPGDDSELDLSCAACLHSSALWCQASPTLWLQCLHLNSLGGGGISPADHWLDGMQYLCPSREITMGSLSLSLVFTLHRGNIWLSCWLTHGGLWVVGSSVGSSIGATSSVGTSAGANSLVESSWIFSGIVAWVCPSRDLSKGAAPSRMPSLEKATYVSIAILNSSMHLAKRHGWPGIGRLDFSTQYCRLVCNPKSSETVPPYYLGRGTLGSEAVGIPFGGYRWGLEGLYSHSQHLGLHSLLMGAQRRPLFSRQAPRSHLLLGSPLTPATNWVCQLYVPSTWSNLCGLPPGILEKDCSLWPLLAWWLAPTGSTQGLAPAPAEAPDQDQWRPTQVPVLLLMLILGPGEWPVNRSQSDSVEGTEIGSLLLMRPYSGSSFTPKIFFLVGLDSGNGGRCPAAS